MCDYFPSIIIFSIDSEWLYKDKSDYIIALCAQLTKSSFCMINVVYKFSSLYDKRFDWHLCIIIVGQVTPLVLFTLS